MLSQNVVFIRRQHPHNVNWSTMHFYMVRSNDFVQIVNQYMIWLLYAWQTVGCYILWLTNVHIAQTTYYSYVSTGDLRLKDKVISWKTNDSTNISFVHFKGGTLSFYLKTTIFIHSINLIRYCLYYRIYNLFLKEKSHFVHFE